MLSYTSWKEWETELVHLNEITYIQCIHYRKFLWNYLYGKMFSYLRSVYAHSAKTLNTRNCNCCVIKCFNK